MKLVEFVSPKPHPLWKLCLQMGITDVIVKVHPELTGLADPWRYETLKQIVDGLKAEGLTVVGLEGDPFDMSPIKEYGAVAARTRTSVLPGSVGEHIPRAEGELAQQVATGVTSPSVPGERAPSGERTSSSVPNGGAPGERTSSSVPPEELILTKSQVWANYEYFIKSVMPTADRLGIRMGLHPDDPCLPALCGYARIFETVEDYDRAYAIYPSPSNAVTFCQANFKLMLQGNHGLARTGTSVLPGSAGERTSSSVTRGGAPGEHIPRAEGELAQQVATGVTSSSVQREQALAHYRELLESMAKLGIKLLCYNFMVGKGWSRSGVRDGRGGAKATYFSFAESESASSGERTSSSVPVAPLVHDFPAAIAHASQHFSHTLHTGDYHRRNLPHLGQDGALVFVTFRLADSLPQDKIAELDAYRVEWLASHPEPWDADTMEAYNREVAIRVDKWLDAGYGSCALGDERCRKVVEEALEYYNCSTEEDVDGAGTDGDVRAPGEAVRGTDGDVRAPGERVRATDGDVRAPGARGRTDVLVRSSKARYRLHGYIVMPNHVHVVFELFEAKMLSKIIQAWKSFTSRKINEIIGISGRVWQEEYFDRLIRDAEHYNRTMRYLKRNADSVAWMGAAGTDGDVRAPGERVRAGTDGGVRAPGERGRTDVLVRYERRSAGRTDVLVRSEPEFDPTASLAAAARHFGDRIAFIHVRDVEGDKYDFTELFHDQGDVDQFALMRAYRELGLDVPVRGDHVPEMEGDRKINEDAVPGYFCLGRLFANGYLKALLKGTENL